MMITWLVTLLLAVASYFITTTIVDCILMGVLHFRFSLSCKVKQFVITKPNRIDEQTGFQCSAYASSYVLRHWGIEENGAHLYEIMPHKMKNGYVYPKGIQALLPLYGLKVRYKSGNIAALKNEVSTGHPVIVMLRIRPDKSWLHYVPVVGYDAENIFVAESLKELANCNQPCYNRVIPIPQFKKLWNTRMLKMPLYGNTYITVRK